MLQLHNIECALYIGFQIFSLLVKQVEDLIREDSRIDQYPKLIKGEPKVILEWQGVHE